VRFTCQPNPHFADGGRYRGVFGVSLTYRWPNGRPNPAWPRPVLARTALAQSYWRAGQTIVPPYRPRPSLGLWGPCWPNSLRARWAVLVYAGHVGPTAAASAPSSAYHTRLCWLDPSLCGPARSILMRVCAKLESGQIVSLVWPSSFGHH
jgi:hypothetical protein